MQYQSIWDDPVYNHVAGLAWKGAWPGAEMSWGEERVWLEPADGTETHGRSGFSIHGGWVAESAGCIDLTGAMAGFAERFKNYGRDMRLFVQYDH